MRSSASIDIHPPREPKCGPPSSGKNAIALFAFVVVAWGLNWVIMKVIVADVTPLWAVAIRTAIAAIVLLPALLATGQFIIPRRSDMPVVLVISLFHMVAFAALMTAGLKYVPVGRSIVLGYTTPLWVAPTAWLLLKEVMPPRRMFGIVLGLVGLLFMFNPASFEWHDRDALFGNGLLLLSAICWSVSILYTRVHRWTATPFQLVFWQALIAAMVLTVLAIVFEGQPHIIWSSKLVTAFAYSGAVGTALGYWAMAAVNKQVPATTVSLGVLATPIVGMAISVPFLGETIDMGLLVSTVMIVLGIAIGTTGHRQKMRVSST